MHEYLPVADGLRRISLHMRIAISQADLARIGRGDATPLASFEQDGYIPTGNFNKRTLADLSNEYGHVRRSTISLLENMDAEAWARRGTASDNEVSVRALAYIIAGHERHHVDILRTKYL